MISSSGCAFSARASASASLVNVSGHRSARIPKLSNTFWVAAPITANLRLAQGPSGFPCCASWRKNRFTPLPLVKTSQ